MAHRNNVTFRELVEQAIAARTDALDIPPDVRRYVGEFLRPSFLKQDEGQRGKSRNKKFEYICNALVRAGGTLTKDEFIKVNVSFYLEEMGIQPIDDGFWCYSEFQFKYLEREFMDRLKGSEKERSSLAILRRILQRREDILDAGIVVKKDDGSYTFHDGIISLIGYLL